MICRFITNYIFKLLFLWMLIRTYKWMKTQNSPRMLNKTNIKFCLFFLKEMSAYGKKADIRKRYQLSILSVLLWHNLLHKSSVAWWPWLPNKKLNLLSSERVDYHWEVVQSIFFLVLSQRQYFWCCLWLRSGLNRNVLVVTHPEYKLRLHIFQMFLMGLV